MSGGRVEVGLGAGWNEDEHRRLGFPFPPIDERATCSRSSWRSSTGCGTSPTAGRSRAPTTGRGRSIFRPKPRPAARPPILVGGDGSPRSMRIAARYADEFNLIVVRSRKVAGAARGRSTRPVAPIGRDPATHRPVGDGRDADRPGRGRGRRRRDASAPGRSSSRTSRPRRGSRRASERWILGTPDEARAQVAAYAAAGVERIMLQDFLPRDLEMIDLLGAEIVRRR